MSNTTFFVLLQIPESEADNIEQVNEKAKAKRAAMVKKALRYFEDKSNRSVSEDNLFTRRKNLAVHLGLDENVSLREIQKINTFSLPVPSSATPFNPVSASPRYRLWLKLVKFRRQNVLLQQKLTKNAKFTK